MAEMKIGQRVRGPDGELYEVVDAGGGRGELRPVGGARREQPRPEPEPEPERTSSLEAGLRGVGQGATLGFGDELYGILGPLIQDITGQTDMRAEMGLPRMGYEDARDNERERNAGARRDAPMSMLAGEFVGGAAVPGGAVAKAGQGARRLQTAGRLALGGGSAGALAGAGYSEEDDAMGVLADAGIGGALGAALAPVAGAVGTGVATAGTAIGQNAARRLLRTDAVPQSTVRTALERDGLRSPEMVRGAMDELGPEAMLADLGENTRGLSNLTMRTPGEGRVRGSAALEGRQEGQQARLAASAQEEVRPAFSDYARFLDDVVERRKTGSADLYGRAYEIDLTPTRAMQGFGSTELGKEIMERARRNIGQSPDTVLNPVPGELGLGNQMSTRYWDQVLRELDSAIDQAFSQGGRDTTRAQVLKDWRNRLRDDIFEQNEPLRTARSFFSDGKRLEEAAEAGRQVMGGNRTFDADVERMMRNMGEGELETFRIGLFRGIQDRIESASTRNDASKRLDMNQRLVNVMKQAFPDQDAFERFMRTVGNEMKMAETRNQGTRGSITFPMQNEAAGAARDIATGGAFGGVQGAILAGLRRMIDADLDDQDFDVISRYLFGPVDDSDLQSLFATSARNWTPDAVGPMLGTPTGVLGGQALTPDPVEERPQ